jgi:hypothetical protein
VNVRELIDLLDQAALELPDGLESTVLVHLCHGREEAGILTEQVGVATGGEDKGAAANCLIVEGHPHADDDSVERRPVAIGDTGEGFRIPYGEGGRPILPGSPEAVAAGCICDPGKNDHGRGARSSHDDHVDMVTDSRCEIHRRVQVDPEDIPPDE